MLKSIGVLVFTVMHLSYAVSCDDHHLADLRKTINVAITKLNAESICDPEIVKRQLKDMVALDQDIRQRFLGDLKSSKALELIPLANKAHTEQLKKIISKHGWIKISIFGIEASRHAWLIAQHADHDLEFQKSCFQLMQQCMSQNDINPEHFSYLYDRVALQSADMGYMQKYGTQIHKKGGQRELLPFEGTIADVNLRRSELGMSTVEVYLGMCEGIYTS